MDNIQLFTAPLRTAQRIFDSSINSYFEKHPEEKREYLDTLQKATQIHESLFEEFLNEFDNSGYDSKDVGLTQLV